METTYEKSIRVCKSDRANTFKKQVRKRTRERRAKIQVKLGRDPVRVTTRLKAKPAYKAGEIMLSNGRICRGTELPRRIKSSRNKFNMAALRRALKQVVTDDERDEIMVHFVKMAYLDPTVLKTLMGKLLPDLKSIDAKIVSKSPYKLIMNLMNVNRGEEQPLLATQEAEFETEDV